MSIPDDPPPYDDDHRSLWLSVDVEGPRPTGDVVQVMRDAYENVVAPALSVADLRTSLFAFPVGADLKRARAVPGMPWNAIAAHEPVEAAHVQGFLPPGSDVPARHGGLVFNVDASFPTQVSRPDGSRGPSPLTVGFSVVQGALVGGCAGPWVRQAAIDWLVSTVERLDAASGYGTVDFVGSFATSGSPYEYAAKVVRTGVDPTRQVRGYQWLTVIGPGHTQILGGTDRVRAAPVASVRRLPGDRWLLVLDDDPDAVQIADLRTLRAFLEPLLPEGLSTVESYRGMVPYRL